MDHASLLKHAASDEGVDLPQVFHLLAVTALHASRLPMTVKQMIGDMM